MRPRKLMLPCLISAVIAIPGTAAASSVGGEAASPIALESVDGGAGYYGQFSGSFPTDPGFFPIGVWFESVTSQADIDMDKDAGLNTYVVLTDDSDLSLLRSNGMHGVLGDDNSGMGTETQAVFLSDELDMTEGEAGCATLQSQQSAGSVGNRATWANFGKGVSFWQTSSEAACFVDTPSIASNDIYWFTDTNTCSSASEGPSFLGRPAPLPDAECHLAANYGAVVDKMRALDGLDGQRRPIWSFVEVGCPSNNGMCITGPEIRAAVWQSIIAGARGITYFNHSFSGPCQTQQALRDPCYASQRAAVKATNEQVRNLAPVLNAPTVTSEATTSSGVRALYKWHDGHFYALAGNRSNAATTGTIGLSCIGDATAVKLGEDGETISVAAGTFTDEFADGNAIHIYRIDGGSTCGLAPGAGAGGGPGGAPGTPHAGAGGGPGGAPGTPGVPRRTSVGRLPRRISLRSGRLVVPVACAARCTVRSRLTTRLASRRVLIAAARQRFGAGRRELVLRLSRMDRRRVAGQRIMRLRTIIVESGGKKARRTQRLVARRQYSQPSQRGNSREGTTPGGALRP